MDKKEKEQLLAALIDALPGYWEDLNDELHPGPKKLRVMMSPIEFGDGHTQYNTRLSYDSMDKVLNEVKTLYEELYGS